MSLAGFYLTSYYFSGLKSTPAGLKLHVLGVPLPNTPAVVAAYGRFYWPLVLHTAGKKPPKLVTGKIQTIDFPQRELIVSSGPRQGVLCKFTSAYDSTLKAFKEGDEVSVSLGHVPYPDNPWTWEFTLRSITKK